jgi:branched-chain amino acid transport system ATP-binding protein
MGLVRSFQISGGLSALTVLDNVRVALQRPNNLATQFWLPMSSLDRLNQRAEELLAAVGLADARNTVAADLSYGRKRVLEIATTLALDPKVLLLDEPMAGMGQEDIGTVSSIIRNVAKERAVLMVEHNLSVVADICHHVTVLQRGEILCRRRLRDGQPGPAGSHRLHGHTRRPDMKPLLQVSGLNAWYGESHVLHAST